MPTEPVGDLIDFNDDESRMEYGSWTAADDLAFALVQARQINELSQAELAEKLGKSQAYVAKLESGEANPTIRKIGAILGAMWLRLEMCPIPLRLYQDDYSAELSFPSTESGAGTPGDPKDILLDRLDPYIPADAILWSPTFDLASYEHNAKGVNA